MPLDNQVSIANKFKTKTKIQVSIHLDQRYPKGKLPLKMSFNFQDNQANKKDTTLQAKK